MGVMDNFISIYSIPDEILENIFAHLSLTDLLNTHVLVCKKWAKIILNPVFIPWKKFYFSVKLNRDVPMSSYLLNPLRKHELFPPKDILKYFTQKFLLLNIRSYLLNCIDLMGQLHKSPETTEFSMRRLRRHNLFKLAMEFINWIPYDLIKGPHNVWHILTAIILLSSTVDEIRYLIDLVLRPPSLFLAISILEGLYCLALFLYAGIEQLKLPIRCHYNLFYAIYTFENSWQSGGEDLSKKHAGQQSIEKYTLSYKKRLTHEQARIVGHKINKNDTIKIIAFAGTGKTTTLLQLCRLRPDLKFLLVVYNKSVQTHCAAIFPPNTTVRTAHALAFRYVGRRYSSIHKCSGDIRVNDLSSCLETKENGGNRFRRAALVKLTINRFANSVDEFITLAHVPQHDKHGQVLDDNFRLNILLKDAEEIWTEMTKCSPDQRIAIFQDGQLKLWQLSKPKLSEYDVLMIDEGQDMNPAMFDIFLNQDVAKFIVGDPYQQIYAFRGAENALQKIKSSHTFYLTQSFRFGPEIGFVAQCALQSLLGVTKQTLIGGLSKDAVVDYSHFVLKTMNTAYLARSNIELYRLALQICKSEKYSGRKMAFAGGIEKYGFEDIVDLWKLNENDRSKEAKYEIKNKLMAKFPSVEAFVNFANQLEENDLMNKVKMYKYSLNRTKQDIGLLVYRCSYPSNKAEITFSTIHKSKGLEWDRVILSDDMLPDGLLTRESVVRPLRDECNLLYVAVTRAKKVLTLNSCALHMVMVSNEKFERFYPRSEVPSNALCVQCGKLYSDGCIGGSAISPLAIKLNHLPFSTTGHALRGGFICNTCHKIPLFEMPSVYVPATVHVGYSVARPSTAFKYDQRRVAFDEFLNGRINPPAHPPGIPQVIRAWQNYATNPMIIPMDNLPDNDFLDDDFPIDNLPDDDDFPLGNLPDDDDFPIDNLPDGDDFLDDDFPIDNLPDDDDFPIDNLPDDDDDFPIDNLPDDDDFLDVIPIPDIPVIHLD